MTNKAATKEISKGICSFCKGEFEKAKMTQHLKYCKQRATEIATELESAQHRRKPGFSISWLKGVTILSIGCI